MVALTGNKSLLRTSVSILAMVLLSSAAFAEDETAAVDDAVTIEAGIDQPTSDDGSVIDDQPTMGFGDEEMGDPIEVLVDPIDGAADPVDPVDLGGEEVVIDVPTDVTIDQVKRTDDGVDLPIDDSGILYMSAGGAESDPAAVTTASDQARDAARVPNLCDTAGPGWNWLCGTKAD